MKLYYAFGGGLGHLSRAAAIIETLGFNESEFLIITNSDYAQNIFKYGEIIKVSDSYYKKPDELLNLIHSIIAEYKVSEIYIDTFPVGIIGELNNLNKGECKSFYIARILKWDVYSPLLKNGLLNFDNTFIVEPLSSEQTDFIKKNSKSISELNLKYPNIKLGNCMPEVSDIIKEKPWLIVHSESFDELQILYQHALEIAELKERKPKFLVISQSKKKLEGDNIIQIDYYPASVFFPYAEKIFTACGFNSMQQAKEYADRHYFIPFNRKYDDQFKRALLRKSDMLK